VRINRSALTVSALSLLSWFAAASLAAQEFDHLDSCELNGPQSLSTSARCGTLSVPENPDLADGRTLDLAFAVVPARASSPQPDPVFFLAGGPGQSALDVAPMIAAALRDVNRDRHLVFLDQRGTGDSNPLNCEFDEQDDWLEMDFDRINAELKRCLADWDADVQFYTSTDAARDLDQLRQQLNFEQINLIGGSYGTRLGQVYLRNYPQPVRSVVLDAVVPTRLRLGSEHAVKLDKTLNILFDQCSQSEACSSEFPNIKTAFRNLIDRYRDSGQSITIAHPRTGQSTPIEFSSDVLASALRFLAYSPQTQMIIPYLVHEAETTGSPNRIASQAMIVSDQITGNIALGLNFAVGCSEDWPSWPRDIDASNTVLGNTMTEFYETVCSWWPAGAAPTNFHDPFDSEAPVLILSGELDPVTPPEYGDEVDQQFSNSLHLVGQGLGHTVMGHPCFSDIIRQFFNSASVDELDTACTEELGNAPFFVNPLGPRP